ncbi:NgoMIV family type II restriction endonuclease [Tsukamurella strandjordii]|uniref:NgoMIV family type II restriction endonuclease n=1 Tax=Tsukamurella strandjordii TaxID=147577 RepID=A0AA90NBR9_9ACTN|nr:NgoMIV family type II restriction endonuclease [Tsukamurella strandjordii]MDP0398838.1 NgoMIV family type II restriction endonuclease [Tsukamurella strandjordii]
MPDPTFARALCGYRSASGHPNTSDKHDANSIRWGIALFDQLEVPTTAVEPSSIGTALEDAVVNYLDDQLPDYEITARRKADNFSQYAHLGSLDKFFKSYEENADKIAQARAIAHQVQPPRTRNRLVKRLETIEKTARSNWKLLQDFQTARTDESQLKIDIAVTSRKNSSELLTALSAKWSLRTDRAQDCVSQGNRLTALRRGRMPHFATVTIEPRPSMLKLLTDTSGSVDCVYHIAYHSLLKAADALVDARPSIASQRNELHRMIRQDRLKPLDSLIQEVYK